MRKKEIKSINDKNAEIIYKKNLQGEQNTKGIKTYDGISGIVQYVESKARTEPNEKFERDMSIDNTGECLFHSLLVHMGSDLNFREFRNILISSEFLQLCENPEEAQYILSRQREWGNADILFIFSRKFRVNICVYMEDSKKRGRY